MPSWGLLGEQPHGQSYCSACADDRDHPCLVAKQRDERGGADERRAPVEGAAGTLRPEDVISEEHRQIEDDADDGRGDGGERGGELQVAVRGFDERRAEEDEDERGQESEEG